MKQISLQPVPSQQTSVVLGGQSCQITVYVKTQCMFFDIAVNGTIIASSVQCENLVSLVPTSYLGFTGILCFYDTQGSDNPRYDGLGSRWILLYLDAADAEAYGFTI